MAKWADKEIKEEKIKWCQGKKGNGPQTSVKKER